MSSASNVAPQASNRLLQTVSSHPGSNRQSTRSVAARKFVRRAFIVMVSGGFLGCADSPVKPRETTADWMRTPARIANFSGENNEEVTVVGQTYGPHGEFYNATGSSVTMDTVTYVPSPNSPTVTIHRYHYALESNLSPSGYDAYNGGDISILITDGGQTVSTGGVHATMDTGEGIYSVPAGAAVTLEAYPNAHCRFEGWTINNTTYVSTSTVFVDYGGGGARNYTGVFTCNPAY